MFDIYDLSLLLPLILLGAYWWRTSEQKSVAIRTARTYCKERELQMLDETLVFCKFRIEKNLSGKKRWCRVYEFDYSQQGEDRHSGEIILSGYKVLRVILHSDVLEITEFRQ